jgi:MFS family permease
MEKNYKVKGIMCVLGSMINIGISFLVMNLMGVLTYPLAKKFGVAYSTISVIWTTLALGAIITSLFLGKLLEKFNPKIICSLAPIAYILGLSLLPYYPNVTVLIAAYTVVGFFNCMGSTLPFYILTQNWIGEGRGSVVGLGSIFSAIFTTIFTPIITNMVYTKGFDKVCLYSGIILAVIQAMIALIFLCRLPSYYGAEPIDIHFLSGKNKKTGEQANAVYETKMPMSKVLSTVPFWGIMIAALLINLAQNMFYGQRTGVFTEMGLSLVQISWLVGIWTIFDLVIRWLFGFLCDKIGYRIPLLTFLAVAVVTWIAYPGITALGITGGVLFAILGNIGQVGQIMGPNILLPMFGYSKANNLTSWTNVVASIGSLIAAPIVVLLGSYSRMAVALFIIYAAALVITALVTSQKAKNKVKEIDEKWISENETAPDDMVNVTQ